MASKSRETDVSLGQGRGGWGPRGDLGPDQWAATSLGDRVRGLDGWPRQASPVTHTAAPQWPETLECGDSELRREGGATVT